MQQTAQNQNYQRTEKGQNLVAKAMTKMIIRWNEEGVRHGNGHDSFTMHSRDNLGNRRSHNADLGISRLKKYAYANKGRIKMAHIYDMATGQPLWKFENGSWFMI